MFICQNCGVQYHSDNKLLYCRTCVKEKYIEIESIEITNGYLFLKQEELDDSSFLLEIVQNNIETQMELNVYDLKKIISLFLKGI